MDLLDQKTIVVCDQITSDIIINFDAKQSNVVKLSLLAAIHLDLQLVILARVLRRGRKDVYNELLTILPE